MSVYVEKTKLFLNIPLKMHVIDVEQIKISFSGFCLSLYKPSHTIRAGCYQGITHL